MDVPHALAALLMAVYAALGVIVAIAVVMDLFLGD
jgi:hypothetical protein